MSEGESEPLRVYEHFRRVFGGPGTGRPGRDARRRAHAAEDESSVPFGRGRDPRGLNAVLDRLTSEMGWESPLARSTLLTEWPGIVGVETAQHAEPIGIEERRLIVRCDSTAWATQLRMMRSAVLARILEQHPLAGVDEVQFLAPAAPSWKRGPRAVPGRGPRDTYG
ncbi:MAG: DUF721 domain-containing protein [Micrococcales bacterium]|nr:DUF721 domain-containing protein [Micrococcales bacterium]